MACAGAVWNSLARPKWIPIPSTIGVQTSSLLWSSRLLPPLGMIATIYTAEVVGMLLLLLRLPLTLYLSTSTYRDVRGYLTFLVSSTPTDPRFWKSFGAQTS